MGRSEQRGGLKMSEAILSAISVISGVCAIVFGYIAFVRNRDSDKTKEAKSDATILTELGYIKGGIDDVKAEQREQRKTNTDFVGRLVSVETSAKQAHKRIDHIEQQIDNK
jgi:hypothetical protein